MSHSWDVLGFIAFYSNAKKSFSVRKKVSISHRKHSTIVSETTAGNLINWLCVECGLKRMNLNFYDIKYRWATLKTSIPTKTVLPRTFSMIHCRLDFNNCLPHYTTTKNIVIKVETDATCVICRVFSYWWKGKSMNPDVVSRWRRGENGSNFADFFSNLINLLLIEDHRQYMTLQCLSDGTNEYNLFRIIFPPPPVSHSEE